MRMGKRECKQMLMAVRRLCGQRSEGPSGVSVQLSERISAPISPPRANNSSPTETCCALGTSSIKCTPPTNQLLYHHHQRPPNCYSAHVAQAYCPGVARNGAMVMKFVSDRRYATCVSSHNWRQKADARMGAA